MKKNIKSVLAKTLAVAMAFSLTGIAADVEAGAASAPKLNKKTVSVKVGKTATVKVSGVKAKKVKKTTWSIKSKKIATLSAKKKTSVKVKGKKRGSTTLTAKIKVGKKTTKKTCKIKVTAASPATATPTPVVTATATPTATAKPTATPVGKVNVVPGRNEKVIESETHVVPITQLNETTLTSDAGDKRPDDSDEVVGYKSFDKKGVTFTSLKQYNSGVSFYVNPCTKENELVELSRGDGYLGFQNAVKDMSDYDYIRIELTCENEVNLRTYNEYDALENESFPGSCSTETYEARWVGPVASSEYMEEAEGLSSLKIKSGYEKRTVFVPIADLYDGKDSGAGSGCDFSTISAVALSPQEEGYECTIHSIDFVKVERTNKVSEIKITCEKDTIANNKTAELIATVGPENATRKIVKWTSKDESLATVDFQGTVLANNKGKTGNCTFVAEATDGSGVKGEITLKIGDSSLEPAKVETQSIDFTSSKIAASTDAAISASGVAFKKGTAAGFVDFSKYLDEKNIDLSAYESISVEWEVIDKDGNAISDYPDDAIPNNAKVAFVEAGGLNGHSDGVNIDTQYSSNVTGGRLFLHGKRNDGTYCGS